MEEDVEVCIDAGPEELFSSVLAFTRACVTSETALLVCTGVLMALEVMVVGPELTGDDGSVKDRADVVSVTAQPDSRPVFQDKMLLVRSRLQSFLML